jgi:D-alanyl-D-alanine carboxypeptidase
MTRTPRALRAALLLAVTVTAASCAAGTASSAAAQAAPHEALRARLQLKLDSLHAAGRFGGATAGVVLKDGTSFALAVGESDTIANVAMRPGDRMLAGSVGKTFFAALALQLVHEGRISLDDRLEKYLGDESWWRAADGRVRLPNGADITLRMLMNHTSGIVRYEFNPAFTAEVTRDPYRVWQPAEQVAYVLDSAPPFAAGAGWDYSDTNYILMAMVVEKVTGAKAYDLIRTRVLEPNNLRGTVPSTSPAIAGLVQGYAGANNPFGGADAVLLDGGRLAFNPQFEWAGGGYASTAEDLARWAKLYFEGGAFPAALMPQVLDGREARGLGRGARYGLAAIIRDTPAGPAYGHSGFFPGYLTEMRYFPQHGIAVSFQANTSDGRALGRSTSAIVQELGEIVVEFMR